MPALDATSASRVRGPIEGPSVWFADDMRGREPEWSYRLSPSDVAELEVALRVVQERGLDIAAIGRQDFPLPTLGPVLDRLCDSEPTRARRRARAEALRRQLIACGGATGELAPGSA